MSSFALYLIGMLVLIAGLAYAAWLLHVSTTWIVVGVIVLLGIGILGGVTKTRRRDPPEQ
jgi:amino acid transporter